MTAKRKTKNSLKPLRGRPFQKGNPGKPKGARNRTTLVLEALLEGEAEKIIRKAVEMALQGDPTALKLCFDRTLGARRDRPIAIDLPPIKTAGDGASALALVVAAASQGRITTAQGAEMCQLIAATIDALHDADHEKRLEKLEVANDPNALPAEPEVSEEDPGEFFSKIAREKLELKRQARRERQANQTKRDKDDETVL
jgi:hypothetical protein